MLRPSLASIVSNFSNYANHNTTDPKPTMSCPPLFYC